MSKRNTTIHDFDKNILRDYFSNFKRQGPGNPEITLKALSFIDKLANDAKIADIGCGTGGQSITLAKNTSGSITGVDIFPNFIQQLNEKAVELKLNSRLKGIVGSMDELNFNNEELDLIWSEGAIFCIGFEKGLQEWRKFIKPGGYIAVSEGTWFTNERPAEIEEFWMDAYPQIDTIPNKLAQMQEAGYLPVATFVLPEYCWTDNFFAPQIPVQKEFLKKHAGNIAIEGFIANMQRERELYYKYKEYYGYVFYIGKKL